MPAFLSCIALTFLSTRLASSLLLQTKAAHLASSVRRMSSSLPEMNHISASSVSYLDAGMAKAIDDRLMDSPGFSIDQLMELAGYGVAWATHDFFISTKNATSSERKVLVFSGPGNNGGDGLVAARHLSHFGYQPVVVYPKHSKSNAQLFANLMQQCRDLVIPVTDVIPSLEELNSADVVIDALFGFSFMGPSRSPFSEIIELMAQTAAPVVSVDVPSGWHVDDGDIHHTNFHPSAVVSLTLPKKCMQRYTGHHYLSGRFLPPQFAVEWSLRMPDYGFGPSQVVRLVSDTPAAEAGGKLVAMISTASSMEEAKKIASTLVQEKLVACVNLIPGVQSVYEWDGKVEESGEVLLMMKTREALAQQVTQRLKALHSYQVPESIALAIQDQGGNADYLAWVRANTM